MKANAYKYDVHIADGDVQCDYACSKYTQFTYSRANDSELRFVQVNSAYSVHSRYAPDTELFLESAHMNLDILRHERNKPCDHCAQRLQHDTQLVLQQCKTIGELWEYSQILHGKPLQMFKSVETANGRELDVLQGLQEQRKLEKEAKKSAIFKGKQKGIRERLQKESEKQQRHKEIANKYAKSHGGITIDQFLDGNIFIFKDNVILFSMYAREHRADSVDDAILMSFNHYLDDHRYLRIATRGRKDSTYIAMFRDAQMTRILHSPMVSFDDSTTIACVLTHEFTPPSEYQNDEYMNLMLIAAGLRNYFGVTTVNTAKVLKHKDTDIKTCNIATHVVKKRSTDITYHMRGQQIIGSTITSIQDFRLTVVQNMKLMQHNRIFVRDLSVVMIEVDMRTYTSKSAYNRFYENKARNAYNIELKRRDRKWTDELLQYYGVIVDLSADVSLGDRAVCGDTVCTDESHKHSTIVYINSAAPLFKEHMYEYLHGIRHSGNLCTVMSEHVNRGITGNVYTLNEQYIRNMRGQSDAIKTLSTYTTTRKSDSYPTDIQFPEYAALLRCIRHRKYSFLQMHAIQRFSFNTFLEIENGLMNNESLRQDSVYMFYIGHIDIHLSLRGNQELIDLIDAHMIKITESDVRFKLEVIYNDTRDLMCAELVRDHYVSYMKSKRALDSNAITQLRVSLETLSGHFHAKYSSIGAVFSFMDSEPLRIYRTQDIRIPYVNKRADYIYHRAHSFAVTVTGAFTNILNKFGDLFEDAHICKCNKKEIKCDRCLHNIVFCERETVIDDFISVKFEEIIPFVTAMYLTHSFNGASTEGCDLDNILFSENDFCNMVRCGHSVEFLYHSDRDKIHRLKHTLSSGEISAETMHKIIEDEGFCLVLIEPINETYGAIKTSGEDLHSKILQLYYDDALRKSVDIPLVEENTDRRLWLYANIESLVAFERDVNRKILEQERKEQQKQKEQRKQLRKHRKREKRHAQNTSECAESAHEDEFELYDSQATDLQSRTQEYDFTYMTRVSDADLVKYNDDLLIVYMNE